LEWWSICLFYRSVTILRGMLY
jgi:hypothetical protein